MQLFSRLISLRIILETKYELYYRKHVIHYFEGHEYHINYMA
jgi:hypothetical protein